MKPLFVETDPKFHELIDTEAVLEPVSVGHRVTEGIIWWPQNNCLIFSDMAAGKVFKVEASVGQAVKAGDPVIILEAMKMEIPVVAPQDGTVASIDVAVGDAVEAGATLASLN